MYLAMLCLVLLCVKPSQHSLAQHSAVHSLFQSADQPRLIPKWRDSESAATVLKAPFRPRILRDASGTSRSGHGRKL